MDGRRTKRLLFFVFLTGLSLSASSFQYFPTRRMMIRSKVSRRIMKSSSNPFRRLLVVGEMNSFQQQQQQQQQQQRVFIHSETMMPNKTTTIRLFDSPPTRRKQESIATTKTTTSTRLFSSPSSSSSSSSSSTTTITNTADGENRNDGGGGDVDNESQSLEEAIRLAYEENGTDGIIAYASKSITNRNFFLDDIINATIKASHNNRGQIASILNAFIASRIIIQEQDEEEAVAADDDDYVVTSSAKIVFELLEEWNDKLSTELGMTPDIVTFSLAYQCFIQSQEEQYEEVAEYVLDKAVRLSKKLAGSKRRKKIAASRRRKSKTNAQLSTSFLDAEEHLKELCGDDFQVLYETEELAVINKPSGIPCFHKKLTTAGKIRRSKSKNGGISFGDISLEDALLKCNLPLSTLNYECFGLVHRLDRVSSGCLVLAKNDSIHAKLVSQFFCRHVQKKYLTVILQHVPIIPKSGHIHSIVDGRPAKSDYNVIEYFGVENESPESESTSVAALVEFQIYTGRKHQIRQQASEILNSPILLDEQYYNFDSDDETIVSQHRHREILKKIESMIDDGDDSSSSDDDEDSSSQRKKKKKQQQRRQQHSRRIFLHASNLNIPKYGINVEQIYPDWWKPILDYLRKT